MKKLSALLLVAAFSLMAFSSAPVATTIYSGFKVTSTGTTEVEVQFSDMAVGEKKTVYIYVWSDSVRFSTKTPITNAVTAWPAGSKIPLSVTNGIKNLRYKANSSSDSFTPTH